MCGICGIVYKDPARNADSKTIERMTSVLTHRGPDDSGYYTFKNVALGHRRLSIVDLSLGHQPIANEDETRWVAFNGEIYNHMDLRRDLVLKGHRYRTNSDTESILHCYEEHGADALQHLRGMFAIAIHDQREDSLFVARDRLGIKPVYYIDTPFFFAFASEIKSLLTLDQIPREIDSTALIQMLALKFTCDDSTLFKGIRKLEPGYYLNYQGGNLTCRKYWDIDNIEVDASWNHEDAAARFRELLNESVRLRLMADVPLGMFLSGGIDSTVIASCMARMVNQPISTFSVACHEPEANELDYARIASRHSSTKHHEVLMSPEDFFATLPQLIYHEDEPIAHPSSIALYFVSRLAGDHVKVVLTGEGSDELFGGYERYYQTLYNIKADGLLFSVFPQALRSSLFRPILDRLPYKFPYRNKAVRTFLYLTPDIETIFLDNYATFSRPLLATMLRTDRWNGPNAESVYNGYMEHYRRPKKYSMLNRLLYADIKTYLLELLMKQDQMSMAASIESRVPFLDHKLVEFAFTLPESLKIKGFATKRILRSAFGKDIPEQILNRPKAGFPIPIKRWFAGNYHVAAKNVVLAKNSFCREIMHTNSIEKLFDLHLQGKYNYSDQIWALLNLELWHEIFVRQVPIDTLASELTHTIAVARNSQEKAQ